MIYKLQITRRAEKELSEIAKKDAANIHSAIMDLRNNLTGDVKKLVSHIPEYRLRVGPWRVLFDLEYDTIVVARILNRKNAYRN